MATPEIIRTIRAGRAYGTVMALAFLKAAGLAPAHRAAEVVRTPAPSAPTRAEVLEMFAHPTQVDMRQVW